MINVCPVLCLYTENQINYFKNWSFNKLVITDHFQQFLQHWLFTQYDQVIFLEIIISNCIRACLDSRPRNVHVDWFSNYLLYYITLSDYITPLHSDKSTTLWVKLKYYLLYSILFVFISVLNTQSNSYRRTLWISKTIFCLWK